MPLASRWIACNTIHGWCTSRKANSSPGLALLNSTRCGASNSHPLFPQKSPLRHLTLCRNPLTCSCLSNLYTWTLQDLQQIAGENAVDDWRKLQVSCEPWHLCLQHRINLVPREPLRGLQFRAPGIAGRDLWSDIHGSKPPIFRAGV